MSIEAGVVVDKSGNSIYHHLPSGRNTGYLPDDRDLWNVFWENRENTSGFAHSHPGNGIPAPSWEDLTTFAAVEAGLGKRLRWWITSSDCVIELSWVGPGKYEYAAEVISDPEWVYQLRENSEFYKKENEHGSE